MPTQLHIEPVVFDAAAPLKVAAKRYTHPASTNPDGLTLLFAHCIGAHKEQWEPTISTIFSLQQSKHPTRRIREAWAFDWQNHGESAVLNYEALQDRPEGVSAYEWANAIASFMRSPRMDGHRIVALGHSAGAATMTLTTQSLPTPLPLHALVLIEPMIVTEALFHAHHADRMATMELTVASTAMRRDRWSSPAHARAYFAKRWPWSTWDARVVDILCEHGLRALNKHELAASDGSAPATAVTLKCDKNQEAVSYPDVDPHFESAAHLARICHSVPVHVVWGSRTELVPEFIQDALSDAAQGRVVASVTRVEDAGHMIPQEHPERLAHAVCRILDGVRPGRHRASSRL
ncbi:hypothetical protein AX16_010967 [Volvariella volvacea WC 439]|nr:hypothetical protein AX16_010967 [Volvariella volvacea WC 439]